MNRGRIAFCIATVLLVAGGAASAAEGPPKPGPEHAKLGYWIGDWTNESDVKENPFMPAGHYTGTESCKWFEGGFAVVCNSSTKAPAGGEMKGLAVMSYSNDDKVYTYYGVDSMGMAMLSIPRGTIQGDTWVYDDTSKMGDQMVTSRYTIKQLSPTSYTFKWEMKGEDGSWSSLMEGKSNKK